MEQERVRAQPSPLRCPYCHEDVQVEARDWVACEGCLGRHHASCWDEGGACATCQATTPLKGDAAREATGERAAPARVEMAEGVYRLLDAHEQASESSIVDYLLSPATLMLYPQVAAETRLLRHVARNRADLIRSASSDDPGRLKRYRFEALEEVEQGARRRRWAGPVALTVCALTLVAGVLVDAYRMADWNSEEIMVGMVFGAVAGWILATHVLTALHWRAVRSHEAKQLYLGLLTRGASEDAAREALEEHRAEWKSAGLITAGVSALLTLIPFVGPFLLTLWAARAYSWPLEKHQAREGAVREMFPPRAAEK